MADTRTREVRAKSLILGLYREARFHPSMCPDIERGEISKTLGKALKLMNVKQDEMDYDPYKRKTKR